MAVSSRRPSRATGRHSAPSVNMAAARHSDWPDAAPEAQSTRSRRAPASAEVEHAPEAVGVADVDAVRQPAVAGGRAGEAVADRDAMARVGARHAVRRRPARRAAPSSTGEIARGGHEAVVEAAAVRLAVEIVAEGGVERAARGDGARVPRQAADVDATVAGARPRPS